MTYYDTLVIDMSYLLHRVLHAGSSKDEAAHQEMMTSDGVPTGGVYGVCKTLKYMLGREDLRVGDVVAVWDGPDRPRSPRRREIYPEYKNKDVDTSTLTEKEIKDAEKFRYLYGDQKPRINHVLMTLGVPILSLEGREGDDVVALTAKHLEGNVLIMSDDRDYYQLVSPKISVYRAVKDYALTHQNFAEKAEVPTPFKYLIYASIVGDGSDNIAGIEGVGGTTAQKVAAAYPSERFKYQDFMDTLSKLETSDSRSKKRYARIRENYNTVVRNMYLMNLELEIHSFTHAEKALVKEQYSRPRVADDMDVMRIFKSYEFKSLIGESGETFQYFMRPFTGLRAAGINL